MFAFKEKINLLSLCSLYSPVLQHFSMVKPVGKNATSKMFHQVNNNNNNNKIKRNWCCCFIEYKILKIIKKLSREWRLKQTKQCHRQLSLLAMDRQICNDKSGGSQTSFKFHENWWWTLKLSYLQGHILPTKCPYSLHFFPY